MDISIGSYKLRLEILVVIVIVFWIMSGHVLCSCSRIGLVEGMELLKEAMGNPKNKIASQNAFQNNDVVKEGFVGSNNTAYGPEFSESKTTGYIMDPSTWAFGGNPTSGSGLGKIENRPTQPIPPPEGQLSFFATTPFKSECCPNAYTSSTGCACMTLEQNDFLQKRGMNNIPYSEF